MQTLEMCWLNGRGREIAGSKLNTKVYIVSDTTREAMRREANQLLKEMGWNGRLDVHKMAICIEHPLVDGKEYLIAVHGDTMPQRVGLFAHEASHLVEMFYERRRLPKGTTLSRDEHKCRMLESLVENYAKLFETNP